MINKNRILSSIAVGLVLLFILILLSSPSLAATAKGSVHAYITNCGSNTVSVIDTATNNVTATIPVGNYPWGVAANLAGTKVYVVNKDSNTVSVIDTTSNTVTDTVPVGEEPWAIAVNSAGTKVYVTNSLSKTISVIDTATNKVTVTMDVEINPFGIAVNAAGTKVYITSISDDTLSVIDTATNNLTSINVGDGPWGVTVNSAGTKAYVTNSWGDTVSVIDIATNTVTATVPVGSHPLGLAVNPTGTKVYVMNHWSNTVSVIDTTSNTVTATVPAEMSPIGATVNPSETNVYVTNAGSNTVSVIDTSTNTVISTVNVGMSPVAIGQFISSLPALESVSQKANFSSNITKGNAPLTVKFTDISNNATEWNWDFGDGEKSIEQNPVHTYSAAGNYTVTLTVTNGNSSDSKIATITVQKKAILSTSTAAYAYITNTRSNTVSIIDTTTDSVIATVNNVGTNPECIAFDPMGTKVYVTSQSSKTISVIDTSTKKVSKTINLENSPYGLAVNPTCTKIYVTNPSSNTISVMDAVTNNVTATVNVGAVPLAVVINQDGTKAYVTNVGSSSISVIDTATNTMIDTVYYGEEGAPVWSVVDPEGTKVYATHQDSGIVSVIDTVTNEVVARVSVGAFPEGIAINPAGTKVYVANRQSDTVSVIDTGSNKVISTVNVGNWPVGLSVNPSGTKVYVTNLNSNTVSVINAETNEVTATINVGDGPVALGQFIVPLSGLSIPYANFNANLLSGSIPLNVQFTDQSSGSIDSWKWDFGDGSNSSEKNPSHTYLFDGNYTVTLTVSGPDGSDSMNKIDYIQAYDIDLSDLAIFNVTWNPVIYDDGDVVIFTANITNFGTKNASGYLDVEFLVDGMEIATKKISGLDSGKSTSATQVWPGTPGNHIIKVVVDPLNKIFEYSKDNNQYSSNLTEILASDLIVNNISFSPTNFSDGQLVMINASVKNIGMGNTSRRFYTIVMAQDELINQILIEGLDSGTQKNISVPWIASSGANILKVYADLENDIVEENDKNNLLEVSLPPVVKPDLVITDIDWKKENVNDSDEIKFNVTFTNLGPGNTSRNSIIKLNISDNFCDCGSSTQTIYVPGLKAGESQTVEMLKPWTAKHGEFVIRTTIDSGSYISEIDEKNNDYVEIISVNDVHPPILLSISPLNGSVVKDVPSINATLSDNKGSGVNTVASNIYLKKNQEGIEGTLSFFDNKTVFTPQTMLDDGNYSVQVVAVDNKTNSGSYISFFEVDRNAPIIEFNGVLEGYLYEVPVAPVINIEDTHLSTFSITLNDNKFVSNTSIREDGKYTLSVNALDEAGNSAQRSISFKVDLKPSQPSGLKISRNENSSMLTWNPNIENDVVGYNVYRNGVKINDAIIQDTQYYDVGITPNENYQYTITAVDLAGHESDKASVSKIDINLKEYGTKLNGYYYLTKKYVDMVDVEIANQYNSSLNVNHVEIQMLDGSGSCIENIQTEPFAINSAASYSIKENIQIPESTKMLKVIVNLQDGSEVSRIFKVKVRDLPTAPIGVLAPTLMEGYRDVVYLDFTNQGSSPFYVNPTEIALNLKANGDLISKGRGEGDWKIVMPNSTIKIPTFIYTPIAEGDIHLENLTMDVSIPTYYDTHSGKVNGSIFNISTSVKNKYQTVSPISVYYEALTKGEVAHVDLEFVNQGTADLKVNKGDVTVYIKSLNGSLISSESCLSQNTFVMPGNTFKFPIDINVPSEAPDEVILEAVVLANYWTLNNDAKYFKFNKSLELSTLKPEYNVNAATDKLTYNRGENVIISGTATYENGTKAINSTVKLKISTKGFIREVLLQTDSSGGYSYTFTPTQAEAGSYTVSATHPKVTGMENDAEFEILGLYIKRLSAMQLSPFGSPVNIVLSQNSQKIVPVEITNLGDSIIDNVRLEIVDNNAEDGVTADVDDTLFDLHSSETRIINLTVNASSNAYENASFSIRATSSVAALDETEISVKVFPATPQLLIEPGYIQMGSSQGHSKIETVSIRNTGYAPLTSVTIHSPKTEWISIVTSQSLGEIKPGETKTFDVLILPSENEKFGVYEDSIRVSSDNYPEVSFPMRVFLTSGKTGGVSFIVKDQFGGVLPGAEVTIRDKDTYTQTFTGTTDSNGKISFTGVPSARYSYKVVVPLHENILGDTFVDVSSNNEIEVVVPYSFLKVEWTVIPTTIKDSYEIVHNITYDSRAPVPYIKMDRTLDEVYMVPGDIYYDNITITNMNDQVSVLNVTPFADINHELVSIEFLVKSIPELKPHESVTIPYAVKLATHHSPTPKACDTYTINIAVKSELVNSHCVYDGNGKLLYRVNVPVPTETLTINVKPTCIDAMKDLSKLGLSLMKRYKTAVTLVTLAETIAKGQLPGKFGTCLNVGTKCQLNNMCNGFGTADCILASYKCLGFEIIPSSWLSTVNSLAKCMFQDECCSSEPVVPLVMPPIIVPNSTTPHQITVLHTTTNTTTVAPNYVLPEWESPAPWTIGNCKTSPETMCVKSKLEINQDMTLEREAFDATLKLSNVRPDYDMENVSVNLTITDSNGNESKNLFFTNITSMDSIDNVESGSIYSGQVATIKWLFIPTPGAGGSTPEGRKYKVKSAINYSVKGVKFSVETWPEVITVKPMPKLTLDYMLPREVYGDDPMTQEVIEPVVPFMWGVRVTNSGYGTAINLAIDSAQPKIVKATGGTNIGFKLLNTYVKGVEVDNTLKANFGNLLPNSSATAGWKMMVPISGNFTNYSAGFKHSDALGGDATSLLQEVRTHVLVHEFMDDRSGKDDMFDFLTDEDKDGLPDMVIDSQGDDQPVTSVSSIVSTHLTTEEVVIKVMLDNASNGWTYVSCESPWNDESSNLKVERLDGTILKEMNCWVLNGKIHFIDYNPTEIYKITCISPITISEINVSTIGPDYAGITWLTDKPSDSLVKYGTVSETPEFEKANATLTLFHKMVLTNLTANTDYYFTIYSTDIHGNVNAGSQGKFKTLFDVIPPKGIKDLKSSSGANYIYWTWNNPDNLDFSKSIIYIDGIFQLNTSDNFYNLTGLTSSATHTISVRTLDTSGNVNTTWVNNSATTTILGPIIANFSSNVRGGIAPVEVKFSDLSINATYWKWDVDGDGKIDYNSTNPVHTYTTPGIYNVTLIASNGYAENSITQTEYIYIGDDWNPWNDTDSDGGESITLSELQEAIYDWRFGIPVSTGAIVDLTRLEDLIYSWRFGVQ